MNKRAIKALAIKGQIELIPTSPFHFDSTFFKPAYFPSADTKWEPGKRWQTTLWGGETLGLVFENAGNIEKPKIRATVFSDKRLSTNFMKSLRAELTWRYNLDLDLAGFYRQTKEDPLLKPIIKRFRGLRPMHPGSLYEYLVIAIVLQNAAVTRSIDMLQTLFQNYGTLLEFDGQTFWCFWQPEVLAKAKEEDLRALKVGYRAKSLIRVSVPFVAREIDELGIREKSSEEQEKALLSLYGIGPASVGYIMFHVFHHWHYLKHISPWEQKIYTRIFFNRDYEEELVPVEVMLKRFQKWGEWKALAIDYAWEDVWWKRRNEHIPWLEKLIRR